MEGARSQFVEILEPNLGGLRPRQSHISFGTSIKRMRLPDPWGKCSGQSHAASHKSL
jgi:hypothetical protein